MQCPDGHGEMLPCDVVFMQRTLSGAELPITASGWRCLECRLEVLTATEAEWLVQACQLSTISHATKVTHVPADTADNSYRPAG